MPIEPDFGGAERTSAAPKKRGLGRALVSSPQEFIQGLSAGLSRDPIVGAVTRAIAGDDAVKLDEINARLVDSNASNLGQVIGSLVPLVGGVGANLGGRVAARGVLAKGTGPAAKFLGQKIGGEVIEKAPLTLIAGQAAGGAVGEAAFFGAEEFAESGDITAALKSGATAGAISLAFDTAIFTGARGISEIPGIGKLPGAKLFPGLASKRGLVSREGVESRFRETAAPFLAEQVDKLRLQEKAITQRMVKALGAGKQFDSLAQIGDELPAIIKSQLRAKALGSKKLRAVRKKAKAAGIKDPKIEPKITQQMVDTEREVRLAKMRGLGRKLRQTTSERKAAQEFVEPTSGAVYLSDTPLNADNTWIAVRKLIAAVAEAPESMGRKLGVTATSLVEKAKGAEQFLEASRVANTKFILDQQKAITKVFGTGKGKALKMSDDEFLDLAHAWQTGDDAGLLAHGLAAGKTEDEMRGVIKAFNQLEERSLAVARELELAGGPQAPTAELLEKWGVKRFLPKQFRDLDPNIMRDRLAAKGFDNAAIERMSRNMRKSLTGEGDRGIHEQLKGSLKDSVASLGDDVMRHDMWESYMLDLQGMQRRLAYGQFLGVAPSGRQGTAAITAMSDDALTKTNSMSAVKERLTRAVQREGGSTELFHQLYDNIVQENYYSAAMRRFSDIAVSTQIAAKLPFAVIPNMGQSINTGVKFGMRNTARAMFTKLRQAANISKSFDDDLIKASGAVGDGVQNMLNSYRLDSGIMARGIDTSDKIANAATKAGRFVLDNTGFSLVERTNRWVGAQAGLNYFRESLVLGRAGRLKGATLAARRRALLDVGVDLDDTVRAWENMTPAQRRVIEERVAYRSMEQTQFAPSRLRKPGWWNTPEGRVVTQFKNFAFNQAKFMRDAVFSEAAQGNIKPLAVMLSVYPVAGEVIADVKAVAKGKERDLSGIDRFVGNMLAVGGLGLATDLASSARFGGTLGALVGPTGADAAAMFEAFVGLGVDEKNPLGRATKLIGRQPLVQAGGTATRAADVVSDIAGTGIASLLRHVDFDGEALNLETERRLNFEGGSTTLRAEDYFTNRR
jgi:hypothetical protein